MHMKNTQLRSDIVDLILKCRYFKKEFVKTNPVRGSIWKKEPDHEYYLRLRHLLFCYMDRFAVSPEERLRTLYSIMNDLYVARRITMDEKAIVEALDKLDSLTNAMNNDHNGEYDEFDMWKQENEVFKSLTT